MEPAARPCSHQVQCVPAGVSAVLPRILPFRPTQKNNERTCSSLTFPARGIGRLMMIPSCNIPKSQLMFRSTLHIPVRKAGGILTTGCGAHALLHANMISVGLAEALM